MSGQYLPWGPFFPGDEFSPGEEGILCMHCRRLPPTPLRPSLYSFSFSLMALKGTLEWLARLDQSGQLSHVQLVLPCSGRP